MSYWVEVHCDVRSETPDPSKSPLSNGNICFGHSNDYPSASGWTAADAAKAAVAGARRRKWKVRPGTGWVCPHCQRFPPTHPTEQPE